MDRTRRGHKTRGRGLRIELRPESKNKLKASVLIERVIKTERSRWGFTVLVPHLIYI